MIASSRLVDITRLPLRGIERVDDTLHVGALTTMEESAADSVVAKGLGLVREALLASASTQLGKMATIGGNLLQRSQITGAAIMGIGMGLLEETLFDAAGRVANATFGD